MVPLRPPVQAPQPSPAPGTAGMEPLGTPASESSLDDSVADSITFENAPAEYVNRPDIQDRLNSFPDLRGATVVSPVGGEQADPAGGNGREVSGLERAFGKRILFVEKPGLAWSAAVHPQFPNTIVVNAGANAPLTQLVGHELTHSLEKQDKAFYGRLRMAVAEFSRMPADYAAEKRAQGYTDEQIPMETPGARA